MMHATRSQRPLSRRILGFAASAAAATLLLAGCSSGGDASEASDEPVTIRVTWWGSDSRNAVTAEAIALFEKKYPNVTVEAENGEWAGYWDKLATQVAAGDAPDVIQMAETYLSTYAERGALLDITGTVTTDDIDENVLKTGQIKGSLYGLPAGVGTWAILLNDTLQKQNGVPIPDDSSWTWDDLTDVANQITVASGGAYSGQQALGHDVSGLQVWAHQHGEELWNEDGEVTISEKTAASWWQYILDQEKSGATPQASVNVEGMTGTTPPTSTNGVEIAAWPANQISQFAALSGSDFSILKLPAQKKGANTGAYYAPTMFWSGYSGTEHEEAVEEFIDFMANDPEAAAVLGADRGVSANTKLRTAAAADATGYDLALSDFIDSIADDVEWAPAPTPVGASSVGDLMVRYSTEVFFERLTPEDAAKGFIADLESAIASAN